MWLLLACEQPAPAPDSPTTDTEAPADSQPLEAVGSPSPRVLFAPAPAELSCPGAIPSVGKTDCTLSFWWPEGDLEWSGPAGVGLHGRSSQSFPKPQYAVELRDAEGARAPAGLFGLPPDDDWLLNGMFIDRALQRNPLGYALFRAFSEDNFAASTEWLWLKVNGTDVGVYALTERIDARRLDLGAEGWLVMGAEGGAIPSSLQYASWELREGEDATARADLATMEAAISSGSEDLWDILSMESFVDFVILEEMVKNNDAYFLSHHLYRRKGETIQFSPWDLDLSFGQPTYNENTRTDTWLAYRPAIIATVAARPEVKAAMSARWTELRAGPLEETSVIARIEAAYALLGDRVDANFAIWPFGTIQLYWGTLPARADAAAEREHMLSWTRARLQWMDANIATY